MLRRGFLLTGMATGIASAASARDPENRPVVLELFTSQGCSSCPPADALLGELSRRPGIMALAWHVDYWNRLGWRDPFASRQWTDRQREYARHLQAEVYTPALVVNGSIMVVGSDARGVRQAIERAPPLSVPATLRRDGAAVVAEIQLELGAATAFLALYDGVQVTDIRAGENSGRILKEYRVVREIRPLTLGPQRITGILPSQAAMAIVQTETWQVIGAADLPASA